MPPYFQKVKHFGLAALLLLDPSGCFMYYSIMNDHESMFDDRSRRGSCDADLDEMPPEDFHYDDVESFDLSIKESLITLAIGAPIVFLVFRFFS